MNLPVRFLCTLSASVASLQATPPNVFLIVSEDNGPELGCYGDPYARTPNLDQLASEGVRFHRAFVPQAGCSKSPQTGAEVKAMPYMGIDPPSMREMVAALTLCEVPITAP
jgi:Sulfatase